MLSHDFVVKIHLELFLFVWLKSKATGNDDDDNDDDDDDNDDNDNRQLVGLILTHPEGPEVIFFKMGQSRPFFINFCSFLISTLIIQIEKSVDGVLVIRTRGCKMVGADETTEL